MAVIYFIDSSSWINLIRNYPNDIFPTIWKTIEGLVAKGWLLSCKEVLDEIKLRDDKLVEWSKIHRKIFLNTNRYNKQVQKIIHKHPTLIKPDEERKIADPYIIALATSHKHRLMEPVIVTEENKQRESGIPWEVCIIH